MVVDLREARESSLVGVAANISGQPDRLVPKIKAPRLAAVPQCTMATEPRLKNRPQNLSTNKSKAS
jgi:hypothetical protein